MREVKTVAVFATVAGLDAAECRRVLEALGKVTETGRRMFSRAEIDAILDDAITPPPATKIGEVVKR